MLKQVSSCVLASYPETYLKPYASGSQSLGHCLWPGASRRARVGRVSIGSCLNILLGVLLSNVLAGCLSPISLQRAVLAYDGPVGQGESELLLFNSGRVR